MDVTCQSCRATYKVDDAKIPAQGIKAKCPKCGHSFFLKKPDDDVIAIGGDTAPEPEPAPAPPAGGDPFAGFGSAPPPDLSGFGAAPPPADPFSAATAAPSDPFAAATAAPPPSAPPAADPFAASFGAPPPAVPAGPPPADPFASGFNTAPGADPFAASFGGGGFGSGGFDAPPPADNGDAGIGGLFQAKTAFEIRRSSGEQIGPFDLFTIKQMIYEQQLNGSESLLDAGGNWVPIHTVEDLGEILRLTGAAAADGGAAWGAPAEPAQPAGGWVKHESVANAAPPAAAPAATPAPAAPFAPAAPMPPPIPAAPRPASKAVAATDRPAAPPPPPPVAFDTGRRRGIGERVIILTESLWTLSKRKSVRIAGGVVLVLLLLGGLGYQFRWRLAHLAGLAGPIEASRLVTEGDRTLASGERGPLLTSLARYREALQKYEDSADAQARSAEVAARIWYRDPVRADMKALAETNLQRAMAEGETYSTLRAQARVALAKRDIPAAEAALAKAAGMPEAAVDPHLVVLRAEVLLEKGDVAGAGQAFTQAMGNPATAAQGNLGLSRIKLRAGEYEAAKSAADAALKAEPDNGLARALAAYLSTRIGGDVAAARKVLREVATAPDRFGLERSRASYFLGVLSEEAGHAAPALHHMRDAVRHYPADGEAKAAAKRLFQARFPDRDADAWLDGVSKVRGSSAMEKIQTGEIEFEKRNWQAALSPLLAAAQEDAGSARAQYSLGRLLVEINETEKAKAKAHFERAIAADPEWAEPLLALARWELDAKNTAQARAHGAKALELDPTLPDAYRVAASAALADKDYAAAEQLLQNAVEFDPDDYLSWLALGEARRLGGRAQEAIPAVEKAAALRPELAQPLVRLGAAYEALNDLTKASEYFSQAAKIEPGNQAIATRAGVVLARQGLYPESRKRLDAVVREQGSNAEAQFWLGVSYQFTGDPEKAVDAYRAAIKYEYFDKYLAHYRLGALRGQPGGLRDVDAAREHLNQCLALKPSYYQCIEEQADIARAEREYDEAIRLLKKVEQAIAKLGSGEKRGVVVRVVLQQGRIAKQQGNAKAAAGHFKKVIKLDRRNAEAMWNLGELAKENDTRAARAWYQKAIAAQPAYPPPYKDLGYILKDDGNECGARKMFEKYVELTTLEEEKKIIQDELSLLCVR